MPRTYVSPPLVEALASVHFRQDEGHWDWTIPGLMYGKIEGEYPEREQEQTVRLDVSVGDPSPRIHGMPSKLKFKNEEGNRLVQVDPSMFTFNALKDGYEEWDAFKDEFERVLRHYLSVYPGAVVERVGLRYINDVSIPIGEERGGVDLDDYFRVGIKLPEFESILYKYASLLSRSTLQLDGGLLINVVFGSIASPDPSSAALFRLDLDVFASWNEPFEESVDEIVENVMAWMHQAHDRVEAFFEASFTDMAHRTLFQGSEHE